MLRPAGWTQLGVVASGIVLIASLAVAQPAAGPQRQPSSQPPAASTPGQSDVPVRRFSPRVILAKKLAEEVRVDQETAHGLVRSLENRGFPVQESVTLILFANVQTEQRIAKRQIPEKERSAALEKSVEELVEMIDKGAGWNAIMRKVGEEASLSALRAKAVTLIGTGTYTPPGTTPPARPAPSADAKERVRQRDSAPEKTFPLETIHRNLAKELGVDEATATSMLDRFQKDMPLREGVMLLLLAKARADQMIVKGTFPKEARGQALEAGLSYYVPLVKSGAGWGELSADAGLSQQNVNHRSLTILGQE